MTDRLRALWDFGDLESSEARLRAQLEAEPTDEGRAEVLTQLARVEGLRGEFAAGETLVARAEALVDTGVVRARVALERGRLLRSSGNPPSASPLFESAFETALAGGHWFIAADAAHMAALVAPDIDGIRSWTARGVALGDEHEDAAYWAGPLLNNLGWHLYEAGDHAAALDAFERALDARARNTADGDAIALARYAVGKALRALGRAEEAIPLLQQAVAWADERGQPDGWFHEELALELEAVGRTGDAREQARLAVPLLEADDPSFAEDAARSSRLRALAGS